MTKTRTFIGILLFCICATIIYQDSKPVITPAEIKVYCNIEEWQIH